MIFVTAKSGEYRLNRRNQRCYRGVYDRLSDDVCLLQCTTRFGVGMYVLLDPVVALAPLVYHRLSRQNPCRGISYALRLKGLKGLKGYKAKRAKWLTRLKMAKRHLATRLPPVIEVITRSGYLLCCTPKRAKRTKWLTRPKMANKASLPLVYLWVTLGRQNPKANLLKL